MYNCFQALGYPYPYPISDCMANIHTFWLILSVITYIMSGDCEGLDKMFWGFFLTSIAIDFAFCFGLLLLAINHIYVLLLWFILDTLLNRDTVILSAPKSMGLQTFALNCLIRGVTHK